MLRKQTALVYKHLNKKIFKKSITVILCNRSKQMYDGDRMGMCPALLATKVLHYSLSAWNAAAVLCGDCWPKCENGL